MTSPLGSDHVECFRACVGHLLGLCFEDSKLIQLAEVLAGRLEATSLSCQAYLSRLQDAAPPRDELRALARELTVGETYFFRNPDQFRAFSEVAVPERLRSPNGPRRVRILSAGCASGEEPYTIAILLADRLAPSWTVVIRAVDLNPAALAKAGDAHYSDWALRETPDDVQKRWFRRKGREFVLDDAPRRLVRFDERNIVEADEELWAHEAYDIVFCRNVLMYFTPQNAMKVVERIERSLAPGGYLFLGHAETLRGLSQGFHLRHTHGTFYYQRRQGATDTLAAANCRGDDGVHGAPLLGAVEAAATWVEAISRASDRVHAIAHASQRGTTVSSSPVVAARGSGGWELGSALELLKAEKFGEALDMVGRLPIEAGADPEVLLLRATLLTHHGQLAEAERVCSELLGLDDLSAGAHYLLALCREGRADAEGARHHDQLAAHLDPSFAMPRLHLGLLARHAGDEGTARRELEHALALLQHEEVSRLLLFGGGFGREALMALCRAELLRSQDGA